MSEHSDLPEPPKFTEDEIRECRESQDFRPILFEWYKFTCLLCNFIARIRPDSPMCADIPQIHYTICIGLLNRCSRLMLANIALSHRGTYGETTAIVDRSIFESAMKISWLCGTGDSDSFTRYLADGLKTELEFKASIEKAIAERGGVKLVIEERMLASVERHITASTLTEEQIREAKKLPDLSSIMDSIGETRLRYIVGQKMGSHHVHGTWPSLKLHYLTQTPEGVWCPRDHDCPTHQNQYLYIALAVLNAMKAFIDFCTQDKETAMDLHGLFDSVMRKFLAIVLEADGDDFDPAPAT